MVIIFNNNFFCPSVWVLISTNPIPVISTEYRIRRDFYWQIDSSCLGVLRRRKTQWVEYYINCWNISQSLLLDTFLFKLKHLEKNINIHIYKHWLKYHTRIYSYCHNSWNASGTDATYISGYKRCKLRIYLETELWMLRNGLHFKCQRQSIILTKGWVYFLRQLEIYWRFVLMQKVKFKRCKKETGHNLNDFE